MLIWLATHLGVGYVFASQLSAASGLISSTMGFVAAGTLAALSGAWLLRAWLLHRANKNKQAP